MTANKTMQKCCYAAIVACDKLLLQNEYTCWQALISGNHCLGRVSAQSMLWHSCQCSKVYTVLRKLQKLEYGVVQQIMYLNSIKSQLQRCLGGLEVSA